MDYFFDDSPKVPCAQRHTTQTVAVYPLDRASPELALEQVATCVEDASLYIGTNANHWVPWVPRIFLPTADQVASGASWTRCDVAWESLTWRQVPTSTTGSAEKKVLRHPEEVWGCLQDIPDPSQTRPFVPCDKPHAYEATGHLLILEDLDSYPSPRRQRSEAANCKVALRNPNYEGLDLRVLWSPYNPFTRRVLGSCWASRPDGRDLPPLH